MDKVAILDYYHMAIVDENMNWMELAHLLSIYPETLGPPFVHLPLLQHS